MKVGQKIWLKPQGNQASRNKDIKEGTVSKVGRKYFEVEEIRRSKFFIDSLSHDNGDYSSQWQGYLSLQEIVDERECVVLAQLIRDRVGTYGNPGINIEKLREIAKLLGND